ncbi:DUF6192 family protein [Streptomyces sp. NPDC006660]|uniref:DUF6192 family protein n=1 Tax=Streptomyces sp. NPDC006660 TaxID=3156901 RepID=UPI0033F34CE5
MPPRPAVTRLPEFFDLVGTCQRFVAATGRIVPALRERRFGYPFTANPDDLEAYDTARVHVLLAEVRRLITGTICPGDVLVRASAASTISKNYP